MPKAISARIVVLFLLIVFVPFLVLGTYFSKERYQSLRKQLITTQQTEAEHLAKDVAVYLDDLQNELILISNIFSLQGGDNAHKFVLLKSLQIYQPLFEELSFIDSEGNELSVQKKGDEGLLRKEKENIAILRKVKLSRTIYSAIVRQADHSPPRLIIVSPIFFLDETFINGAVSANTSLEGLSDFVRSYPNGSQAQAGLFLADGTGVSKNAFAVPFYPDLSTLLSKPEQTTGLIHGNRVIGISPVSFEGGPFYVVLSSGLETLMAPFYQSLKILVYILLLILVAALFAGLLFVKRLLTSPLTVLTSAAGKIRDGDLGERVVLAGENEFSELADTFNAMASGLEESLETLKQESQQRQEAENRAMEAMLLAQKASEAKSLFLANMSHEIRTPINGIMGMTSLLLNSGLSTDQQYRMRLVERSGRRLLTIITGVLDFSKIEAGEMSIDPVHFSPRQLVADAVRLIGYEIDTDAVFLTAAVAENVPTELFADSGKINQVLLNLLSNAVKHTSEGEIRVTAAFTDNTLEICVSDTGEGIPEGMKETIFSPFAQGETKISAVWGGVGLGLAICDRFASMMEGKVWFENNTSRGCSFYFTCHCDVPGKSAQESTSSEEAGRKKLKGISLTGVSVYIAEDEFINQHIIASYLQEEGAGVVVCENGLELLETIKDSGYPDVILMDIKMPLLDGLETSAQIRKNEKHSGGKHVPIIALTGHATTDFKKKCFAAGMDDYLTKPVELASLTRIISGWCRT